MKYDYLINLIIQKIVNINTHMNAPLISVIIPCRNEEKYISKTILSLLNQKGIEDDLEILVVDGMSDDKTREIISKIQNEYSNLRLIENKQKVTPVAMNLGIRAAKGMYIAIMGAHSEYEPDYLYHCIKNFEKNPEIGCTGGTIISEAETNFGKATAIAMSHPIGVGNAKHRYPDYEGYAEGACFPVFKKSVFNKIGMYDENLVRNQDDELNLRLTKNGLKVFLSPKAKSTYYVRETPGKLFKQYFDYGYWRVAVLKKHRMPASFRQLVPILFVLSILSLIIISPFIPVGPFLTSFILPIIYIVVLLFFTFRVIFKNGFRIGIYFPLSVIILHFSYAFGFIKGWWHFIIKE